ncbi:saccharopine dehydrogenase NADP-binding domain-containing protein [Kineosporia sp. J2-2]|uniref:Saccharopine dehydrogenase NADP-binding domain-containing protein n=1 Tax=Kineosporia corallincola TaxID=2835133 RepID=A0ABS5T9D1_9ACTN|nr:saccharopine dehydrogenase NADP-binding domain-containing protein [Kineosporia corallincola]
MTARALVDRGLMPTLAGRDGRRLSQLASELGGLDFRIADAADRGSLTALINPGDVVISTVTPFRTLGEEVVRAAVTRGAHYLDVAPEPPHIRKVFQKWGRPAREAGVVVMPSVGFSFTPGNIAGAVALQEAGPQATRVQVAYFVLGDFEQNSFSAGVLDSVTGALFEPGLVRRGGVIEAEMPGRRERTYVIDGIERSALSVGGSEHFALAQFQPQVRDVDVYIGWLRPDPKGRSLLPKSATSTARLSPGRAITKMMHRRLVAAAEEGPDSAGRTAMVSMVVAEAQDSSGNTLSRVTLTGPNPYDLTARLLAWHASAVPNCGPQVAGAIGPVGAFGLTAAVEGARQAGLERVD